MWSLLDLKKYPCDPWGQRPKRKDRPLSLPEWHCVRWKLSKGRYLLEEKVEIQFGGTSGMEGRSRTLALIGVVNSTFHQLTLNKSASHHVLSALRWKHTTRDFNDVTSGGTAGPSPQLPAFSLRKWADLTCSSYYCGLTTCWNSALNSKQQCHRLAQCYGQGIWAGISWEVLLLHAALPEVRWQHSNGHWTGTEGPSQLLAYLTPDRVGRKEGLYTRLPTRGPSAGWSQGSQTIDTAAHGSQRESSKEQRKLHVCWDPTSALK